MLLCKKSASRTYLSYLIYPSTIKTGNKSSLEISFFLWQNIGFKVQSVHIFQLIRKDLKMEHFHWKGDHISSWKQDLYILTALFLDHWWQKIKIKNRFIFFLFTCLPFRFIQWFVTPLSFWPIKNSSTRFKDVFGLQCLSTVRPISFHWYFSMIITFLCCVYYVLLAEKNHFFSVSFILLKQQTNKLVTSSTTREGWEFSNCARVVR